MKIWTQCIRGFAVACTLPVLLVSCQGKETDDNAHQPEEHKKEEAKPIIYTAEAGIDGVESELYIFPKGSWNANSKEELPEFTELHVIPYTTAKNGMDVSMQEAYRVNFELFDPFDTYSGKVTYFFDKEKHHIAAEYNVVNGKAEGTVKVFTPKGRIWMHREYNNGKWIKSIEAPACSDWTYDPATSNITINDLKNGESFENGEHVIELMSSVHGKKADFDAIIDKSTYVRPLKVNGKPFTGRLDGYYNAPKEHEMYFTLGLKEGLLDGNVQLFTSFGTMTLHEVFKEGQLENTVYVLNWDEVEGVAKPVIYLYPETVTDVTVQLDFRGVLTHTYPKYDSGWSVKAHPDGTLIDSKGLEYYALYWEGDNDLPFTLSEGTIVRGENTIEFLESSLATLGLNRREANEFIMFWLPRMENNAYNLIHFSTDEYEKMAKLNISPEPETVIRVMMVFQSLNTKIDLPEQDLEKIGMKRKGFTVVEWGGQEMKTREL